MVFTLPRDLGDGLRLRRSSAADAGRLAAFNSRIHQPPSATGPDLRTGAWTRDLLTRPPPGFDPGDFTIVEDLRTGEIVSSLCLISQVWTYGGVPFGVGRPELVGTDPGYRRRGLVRIQMEAIHEWSAERGQKAQGITGIPYFYRQFGYEMALSLGGSRLIHRSTVPQLPSGAAEPYRVRPATEADVPFIRRTYEHFERRHRVSCVRGDDVWRYELTGRGPDSAPRRDFGIVEDPAGVSVGFLIHLPFVTESGRLFVGFYALAPGISWLAVTPTVLRYLASIGADLAASGTPKRELIGIGFGLGEDHPCYEMLTDYFSRSWNAYAWYIRVPDVPDFLSHVRPALERRLADSIVTGHTGELKLNLYDEGCRLVFDRGRIAGVEEWLPSPADQGYVSFPGLTFLQLLFGYRTLAELEHAYADCRAGSSEARILANALFPKGTTNLWAIE
jgi:hypothetical protein